MAERSKRELIQAIRSVYRKSSKKQKSPHLDHLELVTELKRNYLNRITSHPVVRVLVPGIDCKLVRIGLHATDSNV